MALRTATFLFVLAALFGLFQFNSPNQGYTTSTTFEVYTTTQSNVVSIGQTTFLTSSSYSNATGTIPASYTDDVTGEQICDYVSYPVHVDESIQRIVGTISGSSPFNLYIMSQTQYDDFVKENPPCGSSYTAITIDYLRNEFNVNWTPNPGDYQILLENIASYPVTYTIQIFALRNASSMVYSTMQNIQVVTSTLHQVSTISAQSFAAATTAPTTANTSNGISSVYYEALTIGAVAIVIAVLILLSRSRHRRAKEDAPRV